MIQSYYRDLICCIFGIRIFDLEKKWIHIN